mmetsp:Transcript_82269/g.229297  ORF Transcript_82269/g.229297 Transcript_82269/m.229297 type:complete len:245 (+) Transcript_82269:203-937(+)
MALVFAVVSLTRRASSATRSPNSSTDERSCASTAFVVADASEGLHRTSSATDRKRNSMASAFSDASLTHDASADTCASSSLMIDLSSASMALVQADTSPKRRASSATRSPKSSTTELSRASTASALVEASPTRRAHSTAARSHSASDTSTKARQPWRFSSASPVADAATWRWRELSTLGTASAIALRISSCTNSCTEDCTRTSCTSTLRQSSWAMRCIASWSCTTWPSKSLRNSFISRCAIPNV